MRGLLAIEILYNQIVAGNKTQTRRRSGLEEVNVELDFLDEKQSPIDWQLCESDINVFEFYNQKNGQFAQCKPRYKVGEVLYLNEPFASVGDKIEYMFDLAPDHDYRDRKHFKWGNKLFMPAIIGRAFIKITGIKCERLLDISDEDCKAEGIFLHKYEGWENYDKKKEPKTHSFGSPKKSFISLYRLANKMKPAHDIENIWVWAYSFEYLKGYKPRKTKGNQRMNPI